MTNVENSRGAELAAKLSLGEVTDWRLHWLKRELEELYHRMVTDTVDSGRDLVQVEKFTAELRGVDIRLDRLRWEVKTMLGFDYDNEVNALFEHLPKYAEYLEAMRNAKTFLERKAQQILDAQAKAVHAGLDAIKGLT